MRMGLACKICLKEFTEVSEHILLQTCGHIFHEDCLTQLLKINKSSTCPQCSRKFSISNTIKILPGEFSESEQVLTEREKLEAEVEQKECELHSLREEANRLRKLQTTLLIKSILEISDVNYSILELEMKLLDVHLHLIELFYQHTDIHYLQDKIVSLKREIRLYEILQSNLSEYNAEAELIIDTFCIESLIEQLSSTDELKVFVDLVYNVLKGISPKEECVASLKALHEHITKRNKSLKRSYFKIARFCEFAS